ncbi:hypothetical protein MANES_08G110150v8 [Manihot esculenta]|uniref:Uncharacterized protein n=1 Tax=Manihot esculenta TaxID=3983 RepID=A0ACB7HA00_MANES|nr:hypothetical protein MANES_08G110150v8 [Manihot esculenta]
MAVIAYYLSSGVYRFQFAAAVKLRFLLSIAADPPIDEVIERGCVPRLVELIGDHVSYPDLTFEAAQALVIITGATLEQAKVVIEHGVVPKFVELLASEKHDLQKLAVQSLGSVSAQSIACRDLVLGHGALTPLLYLLEKYSEPSMLECTILLQIASRTLAILCYGSPPPPLDQVKSVLPTLRKLIHLHPTVGVLGNVVEDACLALSCLSNGTVEQIQVVIDANICERLVILQRHTQHEIVEPAVRIVGNIFRGSDSQIQVLIDHGVFASLRYILTEEVRSSILGKTCWAISNMTVGNRSKIQKVIEADIIPPLVNLLEDENYEAEVKWEAVCALSNATLRGSSK